MRRSARRWLGSNLPATIATLALAAGPAALAQAAPPVVAKVAFTDTVLVGGHVTFYVTLEHPNPVPLTGVGVTDPLPAGLEVANPNGVWTDCPGGTVTATPGSDTVTLAGASLPPNGGCALQFDTVATATGDLDNATDPPTSNESGPAAFGSTPVTITVLAPATIAKQFAPATVAVGGTSTLTFTIANPNPVEAFHPTGFSSMAFNDPLPAGVVIAPTPNLGGTCVASMTAPAGGQQIGVSGLDLGGQESCTVSVDVVGAAGGVWQNTTGPLYFNYQSGEASAGGEGVPAVATLTVESVDLAITKVHTGTLMRGEDVTYTLSVRNLGSGPTTGAVTVTDNLPSGLEAVSWGGAGWLGCSAVPVAGPTALTCTLAAPLGPGATAPPLTLVATVAADATGTIQNDAQVATPGDTDGANDAAADAAAVGGTVADIPTLDGGALAGLAALLAAGGVLRLRRRR